MGKNMAQNFPNASLALADIQTGMQHWGTEDAKREMKQLTVECIDRTVVL